MSISNFISRKIENVIFSRKSILILKKGVNAIGLPQSLKTTHVFSHPYSIFFDFLLLAFSAVGFCSIHFFPSRSQFVSRIRIGKLTIGLQEDQ